jgi:hypothetical protein
MPKLVVACAVYERRRRVAHSHDVAMSAGFCKEHRRLGMFCDCNVMYDTTRNQLDKRKGNERLGTRHWGIPGGNIAQTNGAASMQLFGYPASSVGIFTITFFFAVLRSLRL